MSILAIFVLIVFALAALYVVASPRFAEIVYRPELFKPLKHPAGHYDFASLENIAKQDIFFKAANGNKLHAWYFRVPGAARTILVCHGNSGNLGDMHNSIALLLRARASVFAFDYSGYGQSEGKPSVKGICHDAEAAYDYLVSEGNISPQDIVIYGESLGSSVALWLSTKRPCAGVITQASFATLKRAAHESIPFLRIYPTRLFPKPFFDNVKIVESKKHPLLIIHGENDPEIPIAHGDLLFASANEPTTFVRLPHTEHAEISAQDEDLFVQSTRNFLSTLA